LGRIVGVPKVEKLIKHMNVGEYGYTVPWALSIDEFGRVWLNTCYPVSGESGGTVQMRVERIGHGKNDYKIDISNVNYTWKIGKATYVDTPEEDIVMIDTIPVDILISKFDRMYKMNEHSHDIQEKHQEE
jgi:hypothetical protein